MAKQGNNTLTLTGSTGNSGPTIIAAGTLKLMSAATMPAISGLISSLDASNLPGGNINSWADSTGNYSLNAGAGATVQASSVAGRNTVHFNGNQFLYATNANESQLYTLVSVAAMDNTNNQRLISSANHNDLIGWWGNQANVLHMDGWVYENNPQSAVDPPPTCIP